MNFPGEKERNNIQTQEIRQQDKNKRADDICHWHKEKNMFLVQKKKKKDFKIAEKLK